MNNLISASEYNAEQVQRRLYNIVKHLRNDNDIYCGSQNVSHRECSNCPPSESTQPRSLLCHCLIALSILHAG